MVTQGCSRNARTWHGGAPPCPWWLRPPFSFAGCRTTAGLPAPLSRQHSSQHSPSTAPASDASIAQSTASTRKPLLPIWFQPPPSRPASSSLPDWDSTPSCSFLRSSDISETWQRMAWARVERAPLRIRVQQDWWKAAAVASENQGRPKRNCSPPAPVVTPQTRGIRTAQHIHLGCRCRLGPQTEPMPIPDVCKFRLRRCGVATGISGPSVLYLGHAPPQWEPPWCSSPRLPGRVPS